MNRIAEYLNQCIPMPRIRGAIAEIARMMHPGDYIMVARSQKRSADSLLRKRGALQVSAYQYNAGYVLVKYER